MKPLPVARELTLEDVRIWRRYRRHPHYLRMREVYQRADRRDAALMHLLEHQDWALCETCKSAAVRHKTESLLFAQARGAFFPRPGGGVS